MVELYSKQNNATLKMDSCLHKFTKLNYHSYWLSRSVLISMKFAQF